MWEWCVCVLSNMSTVTRFSLFYVSIMCIINKCKFLSSPVPCPSASVTHVEYNKVTFYLLYYEFSPVYLMFESVKSYHCRSRVSGN